MQEPARSPSRITKREVKSWSLSLANHKKREGCPILAVFARVGLGVSDVILVQFAANPT